LSIITANLVSRPDGTIGKAPGHGVVLIGMGETACTALRRSGLGRCASNQARISHPASCHPTA
jgi:hypothetical protein